MNAFYTEILWGEIKLAWIVCVLSIAFFSVVYAVSIIWKETFKSFKSGFYIIVPLLLFLTIWFTSTLYLDIKEQSFITEHVEYEGYATTRTGLVYEVYIVNDAGESETLMFGDTKYTDKKYTGVVTYTKHSKIVLNFVPDEQNESAEESLDNEPSENNSSAETIT